MRTTLRNVMAVAILFIFSSASAQIIFSDSAAFYGISHTYGDGDFGGGANFCDWDGDGWDDLTLSSQNGSLMVFYKNTGSGFSKITPPPVNLTAENTQTLWIDFDNDGDKDLFACSNLEGNKLFRNDSTLGFVDITVASGISTTSMPTYGAAWGDYDRDGFLDLYIINRVLGTAYNFSNYMYLSNGDGTFTDATLASGTADSLKGPFAVSFLDINNDMWPDIYIAQDKFYGNTMLLNNGDSTFSDISVASGSNLGMDGMCVAYGDYDNDTDLDIYITNTAAGNRLLRNDGGNSFTEVGAAVGVIHNQTCWGANFFDYDNDGDLDLYVSGGTKSSFNDNVSVFFENMYPLDTFIVPSAGFIGDTASSFSNAIGDIDNDGYYDIAVNNEAPFGAHLWDCSGGTNNWIKIHLEGVQSNRDAIGCWIDVYANGARQRKFTQTSIGYQAQNSQYQIFGLGTGSVIDSIVISWPSGIKDRMENVTPNQKVKITEGDYPIPAVSLEEYDKFFTKLYPNPTSDVLNIHVKPNEDKTLIVKVISINGQVLISESKSINSGETELNINVSTLSAGTYFVLLEEEGQILSKQKFAVSK